MTDEITTSFSVDVDLAAPSGVDLCTLDDVRRFLQERDADTQQDDIISQLITRASRVIMRWTGREFAPTTAAAARKLLYRGGGTLDLGRWELRALTTATLDSDQAATIPLAAGTDVFLRPAPSPDGVYQWLELPNHDCTTTAQQQVGRELTVIGDWGWASVPDDVRHACIVTVALWLKRDVAAFSRTFNLDEGRTERPDALPAAVAAMLAHYRTPAVA